MLPSKLSATMLAAVAALIIVGCGGSSSVSAGAYAKSFCQAVGPFAKNIQSRSSALNFTQLTDAAGRKQALQGFMSAAVADAGGAVSKLRGAGTPNVSNGKTISASIVNAFTQIRSNLVQAQSQANALPTSSLSEFKTAAAPLVTLLRSAGTAFASSLNGIKSPPLEKALRSSPACATLVGGP